MEDGEGDLSGYNNNSSDSNSRPVVRQETEADFWKEQSCFRQNGLIWVEIRVGFTGLNTKAAPANLLSRGLEVNRVSLKSAQQQGRCDV
jgi:hypothetical protein